MNNGLIELGASTPIRSHIRTAGDKDGRRRYYFEWNGDVWERISAEAWYAMTGDSHLAVHLGLHRDIPSAVNAVKRYDRQQHDRALRR